MANETPSKDQAAASDEVSRWLPYAEAAKLSSSAKRPRILMMADIAGAGPNYHVGDEAMAEVAIERLKTMVGAENLTMACAKPESVPNTYGIKAFAYYSRTDKQRRRMWWRKPLSSIKAFATMLYHLRRNDIVFICGGGNLTTQWEGVLESRLLLLSWALRLKKRIFLVSQTLGPFSPKHRARAEAILRHADWVGVRDKSYSQTQVNFPVHFAVDDAAFLQPLHSELTKKTVEHLRPALALSLRKLGKTSDGDLTGLCKAINKVALERGLNTIFIPHHSPEGKGDTAIAKDVKHIWSESSAFHILDPIPRAAALKALTGDCELVITMRYHQLVFALAMGVPAVGIYSNEYTHAKLVGAFEQFGLEPRVSSIEDSADNLAPLVAQAMAERSRFEEAAAEVQETALPANLTSLTKLHELTTADVD